MTEDKRPPKFPFAICVGDPPNRTPINGKQVYRTKAAAEAALASYDAGHAVDRIPWEDGMIVQDD